MCNNEKVSVIMGVYNNEETLGTAIESIINQTYSNWELIVCDDASTDKSYDVALSFKNRYPDRMILLQNNYNSKLSYTLNRCLQFATGKYIARMDADDVSLPERLEKEICFLKSNSEVDLVGTAMQRFCKDEMADIVFPMVNPDKYSMKKGSPFLHATILTYKYVYDKLNGYTVSERTNRAQDYDLWFRFFYAGFKGNNIMEPLYLVREDKAAIRRRTFSVRWNAFKTTCYGYKLLGFPRLWLYEAAFRMIAKSIIPYRAVDLYRSIQKKKYNKGNIE